MGAAADALEKRLFKAIETACKALVLEIDKELRRTTPVDTGHARANWIPSVGSPNRAEVPGATSAAHDAGVAEILSFKLGAGVLYVTNAAPYIRRLNYGHSSKAPALFVEAAVDRAMATIERKMPQIVGVRSAYRAQVGASGAQGMASSYSPFGDD